MRPLRIFTIVFVVLTVLFFSTPLLRDLSLAVEIEDLEGPVALLMRLTDLPSAGRLYAALIVAFVLTIFSIIGVVVMYRKNARLVMFSYVLFALCILSIFIHPSFRPSASAASPRSVAVFHAVPAFISALLMYMYGLKLKSKN